MSKKVAKQKPTTKSVSKKSKKSAKAKIDKKICKYCDWFRNEQFCGGMWLCFEPGHRNCMDVGENYTCKNWKKRTKENS